MMQIKLVKYGYSWSIELHVAKRIFREYPWYERRGNAVRLACRIADACSECAQIIDENGVRILHVTHCS